MAPQRFASMRGRPAARVPFRDDTSLVALRYEQTVQGEAPIFLIPVPPRNPARQHQQQGRPYSGISTVVSTSPVIVAPPAPQEQHPAFRTRNITSIAEEWKRDSGAPTSSSVTIREEKEDTDTFDKLAELDTAAPSFYTADESIFTTSLTPSRAETPEIPPETTSRRNPSPSAWDESSTAPPSPSIAREAGRKLAKSFSIRTNASLTRLRKRSISIGDEDDAVVASQQSPRSKKKMSEAEPGFWAAVRRTPHPTPSADRDFTPIETNIPTESLLDDDFLASLTFSKRGSLMFGGSRAFPLASPSATEGGGQQAATGNAADNASSAPNAPAPVHGNQAQPVDVERESQKVRSLYVSGDAVDWEDGGQASLPRERLEPTEEVPSEEEENVASPSSAGDGLLNSGAALLHTPPSASSLSPSPDNGARPESALAGGGIEDWENVDGADVDRYGFIRARRPQSRPTTPSVTSTQSTPRRRNVLVRRRDSVSFNASSLGPGKVPSRKVSARSLNTQNSEMSTASRRSARSSVRAATNLLPHNRDRRVMDDAGEMLSMTPGLEDIAEDEQVEEISEALKKKEWERAEKWRKMAKVVKKGQDGEGMEFEFDVKNPKLIDRTWKGIPDRWRAAAWYSFLATSANRAGGQATDAELMAEFDRLQSINSPDDVQIDLDVPRTVNRHIMFRRRYRGGQRLLFRVLHALSLYFPTTGYVQGMASLAATLLCYYEEEKCFVMAVRMWQLRGLQQLYQPGFASLMRALHDFETHWLAGKDVARKLADVGVDPTAYGTRWYLTLFNLSVPFAAQLRIWDVFMLLGDSPPPPSTVPAEPAAAAAAAADATKVDSKSPEASALPGLDVIHAAGAALMHALKDVLLDSDFENAMKALTSWVPVKDEEMLMKVTRAEWKARHGRAGKKGGG